MYTPLLEAEISYPYFYNPKITNTANTFYHFCFRFMLLYNDGRHRLTYYDNMQLSIFSIQVLDAMF